MPRSLLNLTVVRESCRPQEAERAERPRTVSRRHMLTLTGAATIGMTPALHTLERFSTRIEVRGDARRIAFLLDGEECWVIDARLFAGHPSLSLERRAGLVRVALAHARYPGTNLPADLVAELKLGTIAPRLSIQMALGGFRGDMAAVTFLSGKEPMRSTVVLGRITVRSATTPETGGYSLTLKDGRARAEYRPDWSMTLQQTPSDHDRLAVLRIPASPGTGCADGQMVSDMVTLVLVDQEQPSVFARVPSRRTRITLRRGGAEWPLAALVPTSIQRHDATPGGMVNGSFEQVHLELSERASALIAETQGVALSFEPEGNAPNSGAHRLLDMDDAPFRYPLQNPCYARVFGTGKDEWALLARFSEEPIWLRTEGFALEVGDGPGARLFEFVGKGAKTRLTYAPALLRMVTPVAGALTEPVAVTTGTRLELYHSQVRPTVQRGVAYVRTHPTQPTLRELIVPNLVVSILRPTDLLALTLEYTGMSLQVGGGKPPRLVRQNPKTSGDLRVHFPPQHVQEEAYDLDPHEPNDPPPTTAGSVQTRLAGPSVLIFAIPRSVKQIIYTITDLLNWSGFAPVIADNAYANPSGTPRPQQPDGSQTAIEAPYRLVMSPNEQSAWAHASSDTDATFTNPGADHQRHTVTELWHTRLGLRRGNGVDEVTATGRTLRAIWSPDYQPALQGKYSGPTAADPFRPSLDARDRNSLVRLTADFQGDAEYQYTPLPVAVERLMLSALGAWMSVNGVWVNANVTDVEAWRHQMTMGRDQYVKVVYRGFMLPFGNRASYIKVTERQFRLNVDTGASDTYLYQYHYAVIRQPEITYRWNADQSTSDYPNAWSHTNGGRQMPFKKVTIKTLTTPTLIDPDTDPTKGGSIPYASSYLGSLAFWPKYDQGGAPHDVIWHVLLEDWSGQVSEIATPLIFVDVILAALTQDFQTTDGNGHHDSNHEALKKVIELYNADPRNTPNFHSQKVALAPLSPFPNPKNQSTSITADTTHETQTITFNADPIGDPGISPPFDRPWFYPIVQQASIVIPAVKHMLGITTPQKITLNQTYIDYGLDRDSGGTAQTDLTQVMNKGQVFLNLVNPQPLTFGGKQSDGTRVSPTVGVPNMSIQSISALFGTIGDEGDKFATTGFDPTMYFPTSIDQVTSTPSILNTTILGFFTLKDVVSLVSDPFGPDGLNQIPQLITQQQPDGIHVGYDWSTPLKDFLIFQASATKGTLDFKIDVTVPMPKSGSPPPVPTYHMEGSLKNFYLDFGILVMPFDHLIFTADHGKKPETDVKVGQLTFKGFLSFVNDLRNFMGSFDPPRTAQEWSRALASSRPSGPFLDVDTDGIKAGYNLSIPDITLGVLSLQGISLGAELIIPFVANPIQLNFYFATRENPFILTVYIFGGGGFLQIGLGMQGVSTLEASLEAGVNFDLDLGVASGAVRAMLGIYMKWDLDAGSGSLTGFVDIQGAVNVLGLITASIEIYLALTYETPGNKLAGEASIKVDVHVLFFSTTVTLGPVRKEFAGDGPSPAHLHSSDQPRLASSASGIDTVLGKDGWDAYCTAFV